MATRNVSFVGVANAGGGRGSHTGTVVSAGAGAGAGAGTGAVMSHGMMGAGVGMRPGHGGMYMGGVAPGVNTGAGAMYGTPSFTMPSGYSAQGQGGAGTPNAMWFGGATMSPAVGTPNAASLNFRPRSPAQVSAAVAHAQAQDGDATTAAMVSQEAVAEANEKIIANVVDTLTQCKPATAHSNAAGLLDADGNLSLDGPAVASVGVVPGERDLLQAAWPPGLSPQPTVDELREAMVGSQERVDRSVIVSTAKAAVAGTPPSAAEAELANSTQSFVQYRKGAFAPELDPRQAEDFPRGTYVTAAHGVFEFNPAQIRCLHIDNLVNGYPPNTNMQARAWNGQVVSLGAYNRVDVALITRHISSMSNLEILYFRNNGIQSLNWVNFPNLRQADFSNNGVRSLDEVKGLAQRCPNLVMLNLLQNPITRSWPTSLPPPGTKEWVILGLLPRLMAFNGERVAVAALSAAVAKFGPPPAQANFAARLFDEAAVRALGGQAAVPEQVLQLDLSRASLQQVYLGSFAGLTHLSLADNLLPTVLVGGMSGIERCVRLQVLNLSNCGITDMGQIAQLEHFPYLVDLDLRGNGITKQESCRAEVLYVTRRAHGTLWRRGLHRLDGADVVTGEVAFAVGVKEGRAQGLTMHWELALESVFGWATLDAFKQGRLLGLGAPVTNSGTPPDATAAADDSRTLPVQLRLKNVGISFCDVRGPFFSHVEVLDLSNNQLFEVVGLSSLRRLRDLDLSGNTNLDMIKVLKSLTTAPGAGEEPISSLVSVAMRPDTSTHATHNHSMAVLQALLPLNPRLSFLEGQPLTASLRAVALAAIARDHNVPPRDTYMVEAALIEAFAPWDKRSFLPAHMELLSQTQFDPAAVAQLRMMRGLGLVTTQVPPLKVFTNLLVLDLSNNKLTTVAPLELHHLASLRGLDLSNNMLSETPEQLAVVLNRMPRLLMVAVRGNQQLSKKGARLKLLSCMSSVSSPNEALSIIDTPITLKERVQAWEMAHADLRRSDKRSFKRKAEQFRANVILADAKPLHLAREQMLELGLARQKLPACPDVSAYVNLTKLVLRGNKLTYLAGTGIKRLDQLRVLDLRDNRLKLTGAGFSEIVELVNSVTSLVYLGLAGNKTGMCGGGPVWKRLAAQAESLRNPESPLRFIDDRYLAVDDVVTACKKQKDAEGFRFNICLARRWPRVGVQPAVQTLIMSPARQSVASRFGDPLRPGQGGIARPPPMQLGGSRAPATPATLARSMHSRGSSGGTPKSRRTSESSVSRAAIDAVVKMLSSSAPCVDVQDVHTLNLAAEKLRTADLNHVSNLTALNLSHNSFDGRMGLNIKALSKLVALDLSYNACDLALLQELALADKPHLRTLDISFNQLYDARKVWPSLHKLSQLHALNFVGNPCFRKDAHARRAKFLGLMHGVEKRGMPLRTLNDQPVTMRERCDGLAACRRDPELSRLDLTLEAMKVRGTEPSLMLKGKHLVNVAQLAHMSKSGKFAVLHTLNLSSNRIGTLTGQGLHLLPALKTLDLSKNRLPSIAHVVQHLHRCKELRVLNLHHCTRGGDSSNPKRYSEEVFEDLRGLDSVDGIANASPLTEAQHSAIAFLEEHAGASTNDIKHIDMRGRGMRREHFVWILCALAELPVQTVTLSDNPWDRGVGKRFNDYRRFVIAAMGSDLLSVDGLEITDDERANAMVFVTNEERTYGSFLKRGGWLSHQEHAEKIMAAVPRDGAHPPKNREDMLMPTVYTADATATQGTMAALNEMDGDEDDEDEAKARGGAGKDGGAGKSGEADKSRVDQAMQGAGTAAAGRVTGTGGLATVGADAGVTAATGVVTGSLLTKCELGITFFQVYGLVLTLPVSFEWPEAWLNFADIYIWFAGIFSFDIDVFFKSLDVPVPSIIQEYLSFITMMLTMGILLAVYMYASLMQRKVWIDKYHKNWKRTRTRAVLLWVFFVLVSVGLGVAFDVDGSVGNVQDSKAPSDRFIGVAVSSLAVLTLPFIPWIILVTLFRRTYIKRKGRNGGSKFLLFWSKMKRYLQRISLFFLTVLYMPCSKLILRTFAPSVDKDVLGDSCPYTNSANQTCCLLIQPTEPCIGSTHWEQPTTQQLISIPFLVLYVIMMPLFFVWLVKNGVHEVYVGGYRHRVQVHKRKLKLLKGELKAAEDARKARSVTPADSERPRDVELATADAKETPGNPQPKKLARDSKALRALIRKERKRIDRVYTYEVQQNPKAQTYLYQPYNYRNRYQKILIMVFKLIIVMIALFAIPAAEFADLPFAVSTLAIAFNVIYVAISRPFEDMWETFQELCAGMTNLVNTGIALMLGLDQVPPGVATAVLIAVNGLNLLLMAFLIIAAPIRACVQRRRIKRAREEERLRLMNMPSHRDLTRLQSSDGGSTPGGGNTPMGADEGPVVGGDHQRTTSEFSNATFNVQEDDPDDDGDDNAATAADTMAVHDDGGESKGTPADDAGSAAGGSLRGMGERTPSGRRLQMVPMLENARREAAAQAEDDEEEARRAAASQADPIVTPAS